MLLATMAHSIRCGPPATCGPTNIQSGNLAIWPGKAKRKTARGTIFVSPATREAWRVAYSPRGPGQPRVPSVARSSPAAPLLSLPPPDGHPVAIGRSATPQPRSLATKGHTGGQNPRELYRTNRTELDREEDKDKDKPTPSLHRFRISHSVVIAINLIRLGRATPRPPR